MFFFFFNYIVSYPLPLAIYVCFQVLPYCIFNTLVMLTLSLLKSHEILDASWGITKVGHTFAGAIVGFLLVTRINNALGRYDESRRYGPPVRTA